MYERLTKYAGTLADREVSAIPFAGTDGLDDFIDDFYELEEELADTSYFKTLERYGIEASDRAFSDCDIERADLKLIRALITYCVRCDHFCSGALGDFAKNGFLDRCLNRLKELDKR